MKDEEDALEAAQRVASETHRVAIAELNAVCASSCNSSQRSVTHHAFSLWSLDDFAGDPGHCHSSVRGESSQCCP